MANKATGVSTPHLFIEAITQTAELLRTEIRLLRREMIEEASKAIGALGLLCGATVVLLAALIVLLQGIAAWLVSAGWQPHAAAFLVGALVVVGGLALLAIAVLTLKDSTFKPKKTIRQLDNDLVSIKEVLK